MYPNKNPTTEPTPTPTPEPNRCADCNAIVTSERDPLRGLYFCNDLCRAEFDDANGGFETDF